MKNMIATLTIIIILSCSALHAADTAVADMTEGNGTVTSAGLLYVSETSDYKLSIAHLFGLLDSDLISWQAISRSADFDALGPLSYAEMRTTMGLKIGTDVLAPDGSGAALTGITAAQVGAAAIMHAHAASDISAGTLDIGRIPTGITSATLSLGNHNHAGVYQPADSNLSTAAGISGTSKYYGTDAAGAVGVYDLPSGGSGDVMATGNNTLSGANTITGTLAPSGGGTIEATSIKDVAVANPNMGLHSTSTTTPYWIMGINDTSGWAELYTSSGVSKGLGCEWNSTGIRPADIKYLASTTSTTGIDTAVLGLSDGTSIKGWALSYLKKWIFSWLTETLPPAIFTSGGAAVVGSSGDTVVYRYIPYDCTITKVIVAGTPSGSISFDLWAASGALPTGANTIVNGNYPALSSATYNAYTPAGWTTTQLSAGQVLAIAIHGSATSTTWASATPVVVRR